MSVKINTLREDEIRAIGDAFADYEYADSEWGMSYLVKGRQAVSDYICAYVRMAIKERILYSTSDAHEAFIAFKSSRCKMSFSSASELVRTIPGCVDLGHIFSVMKGYRHTEKNYSSILSKLKIPYIYVGMVAVTKTNQGQGFMRPLLEIAFEEGRKHGVPVVLETDAELKKAKYEHLGMKCVTTLSFTAGVKLYGLVYEPENIPKEWRSDTVLEDARIMSSGDHNIWDRFAPVYSGFVTGTPGNRKAYEEIYRRIRAAVKDKEVLELATGPGVIAKQVAVETKSMIATDYSEKMLAVARRGLIPAELSFERADATSLQYDDDSFDVVIIANALHVIPDPERVLDEIKRVLRTGGLLIAPNFIHNNKKKVSGICSRVLSLAGISFEAKWDEYGYLSFLSKNGFNIRSKQLNSTIPMIYAECRIREPKR